MLDELDMIDDEDEPIESGYKEREWIPLDCPYRAEIKSAIASGLSWDELMNLRRRYCGNCDNLECKFRYGA